MACLRSGSTKIRIEFERTYREIIEKKTLIVRFHSFLFFFFFLCPLLTEPKRKFWFESSSKYLITMMKKKFLFISIIQKEMNIGLIVVVLLKEDIKWLSLSIDTTILEVEKQNIRSLVVNILRVCFHKSSPSYWLSCTNLKAERKWKQKCFFSLGCHKTICFGECFLYLRS